RSPSRLIPHRDIDRARSHGTIADLGDRRCGDLGAVALGQVRLDPAGGQTLGIRTHDRPVEPAAPPGVPGTIRGSKVPARSRGMSRSTGPTPACTVFFEVPLRWLSSPATAAPAR